MTSRAGCVLRVAAVLQWVASAGCSGAGGGGGGGGDGAIGAFNFNPANMEYAAGIAARVVDTFPPVADLLLPALVALGDGATRSGEGRALPACAVGGASLVWTDLSGDGAWSAGDAARIDLAACRVHARDGEALGGSLTLAFSSVARGPPVSVAAILDLALTTQGGQAGTVAGRAALTGTSVDGADFSLVFRPSGDSVVGATGEAPFDLGCFDVQDDPHPALGYDRRVAGYGVIAALGKIMSIEPGGRVLYDPEDRPGEGRIGLVSFSFPECAALGVAEGVGDSDGSMLAVSVTGPAETRLDLYRGGTLSASRAVPWDELLHPAAAGIVNGANVVDVAGLAYMLDRPRQVGALGMDLVVGELSGDPAPLCAAGGYAVAISPDPPLAAGHVAAVSFTGCVTDVQGGSVALDGSVTFTVGAVAGDPASGTYALATRVTTADLAATDDVGTTRVGGAFAFTRQAAGGDVTERAESEPGATLDLGEGPSQTRLGPFSVIGGRTAAGGFTLATAGDEMALVTSGIAGTLELRVSATVAGSGGGPPGVGDLTVTADDATRVELHLAAGGAVTLALDADGDGTTDATIQTTWDDLD